MRRARWLMSVATPVLAVLWSGTTTLPAHAAGGAEHSTRLTAASKTVSGHQLSRLPSQVLPLSSSTDTSEIGAPWSVFSRTDRTPDLWIYGGNHGTDPVADLAVVAANAHHTTHTFGVQTPDMGRFSSSGRIITTGSIDDPRRVYWWDHPFKATPTLPARSTLVPDGHRYLTSAPDGWVEVDAAGQLFDVDAKSRHASPLGTAFPDSFLTAVAGPSGVAVTYGAHIAFVSFSTGHVTALDTSRVAHQAACWSVSAQAAACGDLVRDGDGDLETATIFLDPLDGSAAFNVVHIPDLNDDNPTVIPATFKNVLAWLSTSEHDELNIKKPGKKRTTSYGVGSDPVAGPGGVLVSNARGTKVLVFDRQLQSHQRVAERPSHAEALSFSLSKKRIAWSEDDGAPSATALQLHRRPITRHGGEPVLGKRSTVADDAQRSQIAVATRYVVYAKGAPKSHGFSHRLRVVSRDRSQTIKHVQTKEDVTLSGHRLLYPKSDQEVAIADLKTGRTTSYDCLDAALDGPQLVLALQVPGAAPGTANIRLIDLDTGTRRDVADGVNLYPVQPAVFVHESIVGWLDFAPGDSSSRPRSQYRDMSSNNPAVALPADELLWSLTDLGVLSERPLDGVQQFASHSPDVGVPQADFLLRPYGSTTAQTVLAGHYLKVGPQIAGDVMAWIDARGHLKARHLG